MIYRDWTYMDILKISELEKECFPKESWTFQMLADGFSSDNFYGVCAEDGGEVVGYASLHFGGADADIDNIAVTESYRRNGVGGALLDALVKKAEEKGTEKLFLEVRVTNAPAQILYLTHGFTGLYVRPRYYPDGEDAIVMMKPLKSQKTGKRRRV